MIRRPLPLARAIRMVLGEQASSITYGWAMALLSLSRTEPVEYEFFKSVQKVVS